MGILKKLLFCFGPETYLRCDQEQNIDTQNFKDENNLEAF